MDEEKHLVNTSSNNKNSFKGFSPQLEANEINKPLFSFQNHVFSFIAANNAVVLLFNFIRSQPIKLKVHYYVRRTSTRPRLDLL